MYIIVIMNTLETTVDTVLHFNFTDLERFANMWVLFCTTLLQRSEKEETRAAHPSPRHGVNQVRVHSRNIQLNPWQQ